MSTAFPKVAYSVTTRLAGLVLTAAAVLKAFSSLTYSEVLGTWGNRYTQGVAAAAELLLGLWLLVGFLPRAAWWLASSCFSIFLGISLFHAFSGESSCGCFGTLRVHPWLTAVLDSLLLFGLVAFRPIRFLEATPVRRVGVAAAGLLALIIGGIPVLSASPTDPEPVFGPGDSADLINKKPAEWVGQRLPLLRHIDIGNRLASGRWVVVLYRWSCGKCQQALPQYITLAHTLAERDSGIRVALVELPPFDETAPTAPPQLFTLAGV